MMHRRHALLLATTALMPLGPWPAVANPLGGVVVGGSATIAGTGTSTVTVTQTTNNAIINWNTFNIGNGEKTIINMPGASSVGLERVVGNLGPSQIYGTLTSNGIVFLVNPNGILFGTGGVVNAAGFLATTHDIKNSNFMAGKYNFNIPGNPTASIVNLGSITANSAGFAALVAPGVRNSGTITAQLGTVGLASSGQGFTLDFYGDKLITLAVNDHIASTPTPLSSYVSNEGKLSANGGRVVLTAAAAKTIVNNVINNTGGDAVQKVTIAGKISAKGANPSETGGKIKITGETSHLRAPSSMPPATPAGAPSWWASMCRRSVST